MESAEPAPHGADAPITQLVTMVIKEQHEQEFVAYASDFAARVSAEEPGTLLYQLTRHGERPHTYVWLEGYRDEQALQEHMKTASMAEAMSTITPWWSEPPELVRLVPVAT